MKRNVQRHAVIQPQDQSIRLIALTQGQNAIVDANDYDWLNQWNWFALFNKCTHTYYVAREAPKSESCKFLLLHRVIMGAADDQIVDHRDGNTLDCRRNNLRFASTSESIWNRRPQPRRSVPGPRGAYLRKERGTWASRIMIKGKTRFLGTFPTAELASVAYEKAAKELQGEFYRAN